VATTQIHCTSTSGLREDQGEDSPARAFAEPTPISSASGHWLWDYDTDLDIDDGKQSHTILSYPEHMSVMRRSIKLERKIKGPALMASAAARAYTVCLRLLSAFSLFCWWFLFGVLEVMLFFLLPSGGAVPSTRTRSGVPGSIFFVS
jgi:hypothetical protein